MTMTNKGRFGRLAAWLVVLVALLSGNPAAADTVTYIHNDVAGTPLMATDAEGNVVWKETYQPFGSRLNNQAEAESNNKWFTGKPYDPNTGLSYFGARYYDPVIGRFMGMDPAAVDPGNIQGLNRYAYANNNPYRYVDPDGKQAQVIPALTGWVLSGAALSGITNAATQLVLYRHVQWGGVGGVADAMGDGVILGPIMGVSAGRAAAFRVVARDEVAVVPKGAMARGKEAESRVLNDLGLPKNTKKVSTAEGNAIPDALTSTKSIEIKDTVCVSCTKQVRIQTGAAKEAGRESVLITGFKTRVSGPAEKAFDRIIRRGDLGPQ